MFKALHGLPSALSLTLKILSGLTGLRSGLRLSLSFKQALPPFRTVQPVSMPYSQVSNVPEAFPSQIFTCVVPWPEIPFSMTLLCPSATFKSQSEHQLLRGALSDPGPRPGLLSVTYTGCLLLLVGNAALVLFNITTFGLLPLQDQFS